MLDRLRNAGLRKAAIRNFFRHPIRCFAGQLFAPILLLALLAGCGPQPKPSIAGYGTTLYDVPAEQLGLLAGSFGTLKSERRFSGSRLLIRHVTTGQTAAFEFHGGGFLVASDQADFNKSESRGTVFTMKLPAGSYEIYGFGLFQSGAFGGWYGSMREFSVPFAIEPGKVTYVGEYILRRTPGGNVEGLNAIGASTGAYLEFEDQQVRDLAIARQKWPDFAAAPVVFGMPDLSQRHPIVVRPGAPPPDGVRGAR
jgi:hypothetical protein